MEIKRTHNFKAVNGLKPKSLKRVFKDATQSQTAGDSFVKSEQPQEINLQKAAKALWEEEKPTTEEQFQKIKVAEVLIENAKALKHQIFWQVKIGDRMSADDSAVDAKGNFYVSVYDKDNKGQNLYCISPEGKIKWKMRTDRNDYHEYYRTAPAFDLKGNLYVGCGNGVLYAVNPEKNFNKVNWKIKTGIIFSSPVIAPDGTTYAASGQTLYSINPNGKINWKTRIVNPLGVETDKIAATAIAADGKTIYACNFGGELFAVNSNGKIKWNRQIDKETFLTKESLAVAPDGRTIYTNSQGYLSAFDPIGQLKWKVKARDNQERYSSMAFDAKGNIYIIGYDQSDITAISPKGQIKWRLKIINAGIVPLAKNGARNFDANGNLMLESSKGVIIISPEGKVKGKIQIDELAKEASTSPLVEEKENLFMCCHNHNIYCLKPDLATEELSQPETAQPEKEAGTAPKEKQAEKPGILRQDDYIIIDGVKLPKRKKA